MRCRDGVWGLDESVIVVIIRSSGWNDRGDMGK